MEFKLNLYSLRENRPMKVETFAQMISTSLYEKRFIVASVNNFTSFLQLGTLLRLAYSRRT